MTVVVDASAIVDALLGVDSVVRRLSLSELHAPVTIDAEVVHGLRRKWLGGLLGDDHGSLAIELFQTIPITRHPVQPFVNRLWAVRRNITAYDAGYIALAELLDVPLLTRDRRLSRSSGHAARVEYID